MSNGLRDGSDVQQQASAHASRPVAELARIPGLDGLRAVAISLVLLSHLSALNGFVALSNLVALGSSGVRVFFVISGFLITTLLINEQRRYGSICLRRFYFRRTLRIFPAFYAYLLAIMALAAVQVIALRPGDLLHAVTYTMNYHRDRAWEVGHLWSLSVEEQFYLLWPVVVAWCGIRRAGMCAAAMLAVAPIARCLTWVLFPQLRAGIGETFITVTDSLAVGCVLAIVRPYLDSKPLYQAVMKSVLTPIAGVVAYVAITHFEDYASFSMTIGFSIMNLIIALMIDWCIRNSGHYIGRFLNSAPLVHLGALSYSLYLWQQPFNDHQAHQAVQHFPLNIVLALLLAVASYRLIEAPLLKVRSRLERRYLPTRENAFAGSQLTRE